MEINYFLSYQHLNFMMSFKIGKTEEYIFNQILGDRRWCWLPMRFDHSLNNFNQLPETMMIARVPWAPADYFLKQCQCTYQGTMLKIKVFGTPDTRGIAAGDIFATIASRNLRFWIHLERILRGLLIMTKIPVVPTSRSTRNNFDHHIEISDLENSWVVKLGQFMIFFFS